MIDGARAIARASDRAWVCVCAEDGLAASARKAVPQ